MTDTTIQKTFYIGLTDRLFKTLLFGSDTLRTMWFIEKCLGIKVYSFNLNKTFHLVQTINSKEKLSDVVATINDNLTVCFEANSQYNKLEQVKNFGYVGALYSDSSIRGEKYSKNKWTILIDITSKLPKSNIRDIDRYKVLNEEDVEDLYIRNFVIKRFNIDRIKKYMYTLDEEKINEYCHLIMLVLNKRELTIFSNNKYLSLENKKQIKSYRRDLIAMNNNIRLIDLIDHDEQMKKLHISEGYEEGIEIGKEQGRNEGINIGKEQGRSEGEIEMTKKMLKDGMSPNVIKKYVNLSLNKINKIKLGML